MSASVMRTFVAAITLWIVITLQGNLFRNLHLIKQERRALRFIIVGSLLGPVIGASLMLVSLQFTSVGVSSTLVSTSPIMLIPIGYFVFNERISLRAVIGTVVAMIGIAILFT